MKSIRLHLLLLAVLSLMSCSRKPVASIQMLSGKTMGTTYSVKFIPPSGQAITLLKVAKAIQNELDEVNAQMSTYDPGSEISRFNASESIDWFEVSQDTAEVVQLALAVSEQTDGAFDVTVGPLVDLWGFGPEGRADSTPGEGLLKRTVDICGYEKLKVQLDTPAIRKSVSELRIDLSAVAKGHGVDRVAKVLQEQGIEQYYVEVGGEVRTRGKKIDGSSWRVGIEKPIVGQRDIEAVVELSGNSLATSGNYRNLYELGSEEISHTIDPRSGRPIQSSVVSASVISEDCSEADAIATSMMVLGEEQGMQLAAQHGWAVLLMVRNGDEIKQILSPKMVELDLLAEAVQ